MNLLRTKAPKGGARSPRNDKGRNLKFCRGSATADAKLAPSTPPKEMHASDATYSSTPPHMRWGPIGSPVLCRGGVDEAVSRQGTPMMHAKLIAM